MRERAMAVLHHWAWDVNDADPEQRAWKQAYAEGVTVAYERAGVIAADEAERWLARIAAPGDDPSSDFADERARVAAERHLEELLARVVPLRREQDADELAAAEECSGAIAALAAAGVLDDEAHAGWRKRLLGAQAPWLDEPELPSDGWTAYAVRVPPQNEDEAAQDAAMEATLAQHPQQREVRNVVTGSPVRHDGLAIVAVVAYEDCAELHFHALMDAPDPDGSGRAPGAFHEALDRLVAPLLRDDHGNGYEPIRARPRSAGGRPGAIGGSWLYTPAPPPGVTGFTAVTADGEHTWRVGESGPTAR